MYGDVNTGSRRGRSISSVSIRNVVQFAWLSPCGMDVLPLSRVARSLLEPSVLTCFSRTALPYLVRLPSCSSTLASEALARPPNAGRLTITSLRNTPMALTLGSSSVCARSGDE
jgi:hypothetical protein